MKTIIINILICLFLPSFFLFSQTEEKIKNRENSFNTSGYEKTNPVETPETNQSNIQPERVRPLTMNLYIQSTPRGEMLLDKDKKPLLLNQYFRHMWPVGEEYVILHKIDNTFNVYSVEEKRYLFDEVISSVEFNPKKKEDRRYRIRFKDADIIYDQDFKCITNCDRNVSFYLELTNNQSIYIAKDRAAKEGQMFLWSGKKKIGREYPFIGMINESKIIFSKDLKNFGVLDSNGKVIIDDQFREINFLNGFFRVEQDGKIGFISEDTKKKIPCVYSSYERVMMSSGNGFYLVFTKNNDTIDIYSSDLDKRFSVTHDQPLYTGDIFSNIYPLTYKSKKGWIFFPSEKVVAPVFDQIVFANKQQSDTESFFIVKNEDKYGIVDINGVELFPLLFDKLEFVYNEEYTKEVGCKLTNNTTKEEVVKMF